MLWHLVLAFFLCDFIEAQCPSQCSCRAGSTIVDCSRRRLTAVPNTVPKEAMQLILAHNRIVELGDRALSGLGNLTSLDLSSNQLATVSARAFQDCCSRLEILILTNNKISAIAAAAFDSLVSLRVLHITQNQFRLVPVIGSNGSTNLEELYMGNNRLISATFPSNYNVSKKITRLTLSNNPTITELGSSDFASLKDCAVRRLYLSRCQIRVIQAGSLSVLTSLSSLTIDHNPLGSDGFAALLTELRSAGALESLGASDVQLNTPITPGLMSRIGQSALQVLDIAKNNIPSIENRAFGNMSGLHHIDLSSAGLRTLGPQAFDGLSYLTELRLPNNMLDTLVPFPHSVTKLDFSGNRLQYLSSGLFSSMSKLTWLSLGRNLVQRAETGAFGGLFALKWLDISSNGMPSLSPELLAPLASLTFFNASNNKIRLPYSKVPLFASQTKLSVVDLSYNDMDSISWHMLTGLEAVKYFNLSHNIIGACFSNLTCSEDVFSNVGTVEEIDLSANGITVLPRRLFHNLTQLRLLRLSTNGFLSWDNLDLFSGDINLASLYLDDNQISVLNSTSFANLPSLQTVSLRGNPLACTCDMVWFREWVNSTRIALLGLSEYTCHSPPDATGKQFLQFDPTTLVCTSPPILLLATTLSSALALSLVILIVTYRYRWKIRFRIYKLRCLRAERRRPGYEPLSGREILYPAYISHCRHADCRGVVVEELLPRLDEGGTCDAGAGSACGVHVDEKFLPNRSVIANVVEAIDSSAVFIVFLCPHYRCNRLCELELELAFTKQLDGCGSQLRVVTFGDVSPKCIPRLLKPSFERDNYWKWVADDVNSQQRLCDVLREELKNARVLESGRSKLAEP